MVQETRLDVAQLIQPIFLISGESIEESVISLPIAHRRSLDKIKGFIASCVEVGLQSFILFPVVEEAFKDSKGSYALNPNNFYLQAADQIKSWYPDITLVSDVALDPYSSNGHDGLVVDGKIANDDTLPILADMAVLQAQAGFDIIGPSDMMDGRVGAIRSALDEAGYTDTSIMSYTAKYASTFYGPFRDALDSKPKDGDKKTYQMDPANRREALREATYDADEGADYLMVKPALHYLDVVSDLKSLFDLPIAAYHVSGECAMLWAAAQQGLLDYESAVEETLVSIKRAGADIIITYFAKEWAEWQ